MIPDIGVIIGFYVVTRMFALLQKKENSTTLVKVFAILTIVVTVIATLSLITASASVPTSL